MIMMLMMMMTVMKTSAGMLASLLTSENLTFIGKMNLIFICLTILLLELVDCLFVLRFYGPVNSMGSCRAWSVYLTTHLLGRLSPLSG